MKKYYSKRLIQNAATSSSLIFLAALVTILLGLTNKTFAQTPVLSYSGPQTYKVSTAISTLSPTNTGGAVAAQNTVTLASGFNNLRGLAVDKSGNVYVANNGSNDIEELPVGSSTPVIIGSGFNGPAGVAVDAAGDVYVTDNLNQAVKEIPAGNGAVVTISTSFASPYGIAIDGSGNLYVSDDENSNVTKIPAGGGTATVIGAGFSVPTGIAVDAAGNVYVAERGNNDVKEIPVAGGSFVTIASGLSAPNGVAVDGAGNIFIDDDNNYEIKRVPAGGGDTVVIGSGFIGPTGVAVDKYDNVYVSDDGSTDVKEITAGGYFINPVLPAGLSFSNTTGIISGTPTVSAAATNYLITGYNSAGGSTATINITVNSIPKPTLSYKSPDIFNDQQAITPLTPVSSGVGAAGSNVQVTIASALSNLKGVAVDVSGNVYAVENGANIIGKFPAGGGTPVTIGSGFNQPAGVAVDAAGNVYVGDYINNAVKEVPVGGGAIITLGSGFNGPYGVAVGASGNVYVSDANNNEVKEILVGNSTPVVIGTGFDHPTGVAVDAAGNVYVADRGNNAIKKILAAGGSTVTLAPGFGNPNGVAVDKEGNVYFADTENATVTEIPAAGGANIALGTGFSNPTGLAIDASNDIYVADNGTGNITEIKPTGGFYINPALPAGLSFSNGTGVISGTPTVSSPATNYTVTAYNVGGSTTAVVNISVTTADVGLANLTLSTGVLTPVFATSTTSYTVAEPNGTTSITVTPTTSNATYTVSVNGTSVTSGSPSFSIPLTVGANTISVTVASQGGTTLGIYTIDANRALSSNANLAKLTASAGTLSPAFAATTTSYTTSVPYNTTSTTITPTTADPTATITVDGTTVASGAASPPISLNIGRDTIPVVVAAQDGVTKQTYTVIVTRSAPSSNADLANIVISPGTLSPVFASGTLSYSVNVSYATASISVTPTLADANASLILNNQQVTSGTVTAIPLSVGVNTIVATITAQDDITTQTYKITVTRAPSTNDNLANLVLSEGALAPAFSSSINSYTASVNSGSITVTPTASDPTATITVDNSAVVSGAQSQVIPLNTGLDTINVKVVAGDGITTQTYTVIIDNGSSNANLTGLKLSSGTLTPSFASGTTGYTATVSNTTTSITVTPTVSAAGSTVKVNGTAVTSGGASGAIALNIGSNKITTVVTAQNETTTETYTVTVTRTPATNAKLSYLGLSQVVLSPSFATATTSYTASVANTLTSINVEPIEVGPGATIKVNGVTVASGATTPVVLVVGANTINTVVTAQDGVTQLTYTVVVTRAPSAIATLANLTLSGATLSPAFASTKTSYTATVGNAVTSITETPTTTDPTATITVNGTAVTSGSPSSAIALGVGGNTITTVVTAANGTTTDTYTVTVTRTPSSNAKLSYLGLSQVVLSPSFATATTSYTASVANTISSTNVEPIEVGPGATIKINGVAVASGASTPVALSAGANTINTVVTAQDGITQITYSALVTRAPSAIATLSNLTLSSGTLSPAFAGSTKSYTGAVGNAVTAITETPTTTDPTATVKVNGTAVISGSASGAIALIVGANTITTVVTAQNGTTTDTYTITVTRAPSSNAKLSYLGLSKVVLSPAFATTTTSYTASVANTLTSTNVEPITVDPTATIELNGVAVASGSSTAVALNVGANTINTVVTAQDGVTKITYTVTVTRAAPAAAYVVYDPISVEKPTDSPQLADGGIVVHQGVSPNGDGIDDYLQIDGITQYPDNKLTIINRSGVLVYEAKGYDNSSRTFDGHSNKNGQMQLPGTYFYSLDYNVGGIIKHRTGYIVLKY